jgi:Apea-like HEPN
LSNDRTLEEQLAGLVEEIRRDVPDVDQLPDLNVSMDLMRVMRDPTSSVAKFQTSLIKDPSLHIFFSGLIEGQYTGTLLQDHVLPLVIIRAALREGEPERIIAEHREFAARRVSPLRNYFAVGGCRVDQAIQIRPRLRLIPWSDVPGSRTKRKFSGLNTGGLMGPTELIVPTPVAAGCAIEIDPQEDVKLLSDDQSQWYQRTEDTLRNLKNAADRDETARDVVRCIFLLTLFPTDIIGSWHEPTDAAARRLFGGNLTYGRTLFELAMNWPPDTPLEGSIVRDRYLEFARLVPNMRDVLRHAIDRLNWAKRRDSVVDRAIDLGIALEMLLLHDIKPKSELSFRLAINGAKLLGGSSSKQKDAFRILRKAYELRSNAVHEGQLDAKNVANSQSHIDDAIALGAKIATKLLKIGRFPNWEADYWFSESL